MKSPIFISVAISQTLAYAMRPLIQCSAWHDVAVYGPPFAGTHCDDPWRDGQLTCMAGYIHSEVVCSPITVTHPCTMWAWCRLEWRCWLRLSSYMCDVDFNNNTHTHTFNGPLSGSTWASRYHKGKTKILLKQETLSDSSISWAICKSAPRSRQITMPSPHHSVFYRPDTLPLAQPTVSKHWRHSTNNNNNIIIITTTKSDCLLCLLVVLIDYTHLAASFPGQLA